MKDDLLQNIRFCTAPDGVRLAYATLGKGPPLVRAAHFLTHVEYDLKTPVWRPWLAGMSRGRALIRYDGRNCGLSDATPDVPTIDDLVGDLEAVVDAAGLDRFALLGSSQGAAIAVAYAARHPERVACLILLGGYLRGLARRDPTPDQVREGHLLQELVEIGWGRDNPAFRQVFTSMLIPDATPEQVRGFNELQRLSASAESAARTFAANADIDVSSLAARVACPTLVMHVRGDARVPFEEGRLIAASIPGARFVPLEGRNHILLMHEPAFEQCLAELHAFVDEHLGVRPQDPFPGLTRRERELLELLAQGFDNMQIAAHLGLTEKTVRNKVSMVFDKVEVGTRAQAIVRAREAGFGRTRSPR
ncbi:MAG TPA: alpha/beta fold hydrolase [Rhodocyclaceae bacterium]|nr:alpha/beta fold hydrolase [Rhodocyclaceae bacterium]HRQ47488.1 alpha/beta fold hydrolase [Rhodocyclaceae bacterium]